MSWLKPCFYCGSTRHETSEHTEENFGDLGCLPDLCVTVREFTPKEKLLMRKIEVQKTRILEAQSKIEQFEVELKLLK
jgi:hypothetical protein